MKNPTVYYIPPPIFDLSPVTGSTPKCYPTLLQRLMTTKSCGCHFMRHINVCHIDMRHVDVCEGESN